METIYTLEKTLYLPTKNKLWGVVFSPNDIRVSKFFKTEIYSHFWCWWGIQGKSINIKKHVYSQGSIRVLEHKKLNNNYELIEEKQLLELWPDFYSQLHHRIIFEVLANHE